MIVDLTTQHRIILDGAFCANKKCAAEGHVYCKAILNSNNLSKLPAAEPDIKRT